MNERDFSTVMVKSEFIDKSRIKLLVISIWRQRKRTSKEEFARKFRTILTCSPTTSVKDTPVKSSRAATTSQVPFLLYRKCSGS